MPVGARFDGFPSAVPRRPARLPCLAFPSCHRSEAQELRGSQSGRLAGRPLLLRALDGAARRRLPGRGILHPAAGGVGRARDARAGPGCELRSLCQSATADPSATLNVRYRRRR
jgi:hypothetical protein